MVNGFSIITKPGFYMIGKPLSISAKGFMMIDSVLNTPLISVGEQLFKMTIKTMHSRMNQVKFVEDNL